MPRPTHKQDWKSEARDMGLDPSAYREAVPGILVYIPPELRERKPRTRKPDPIAVHAALAHVVTQYDREQATRKGYNRYALSMYLGACQSVESYLRETPLHNVRAAIVRYFTGRLLNVCLRAVGESPATQAERR